MRREPGRRRRRRAGEADGRSGFRLSPQRSRRRRERRGEREAEEGEATSLPGPRAARDAGTQEEEDGEEEAVAAAPHAHTQAQLPRLPTPPAAAARHAGSRRRGGRPPSQGTGAGPGGRGGAWWAGLEGRPPAPGAHLYAPRTTPRSLGRRLGLLGEGTSATSLHAHPPSTPRRHLTLEGRAVSGKQASTPRWGACARSPSPPCLVKSKHNKKRKGVDIHLSQPPPEECPGVLTP